jgi:chromosome partitioning protein
METTNSKSEALILGFANQKGGVGKSTLTHLTAKTLGSKAMGSKKVLVLEIDKQATLNQIRESWSETHENYNYPYDLITCTLENLLNHLNKENGSKYDFIFIDMPGTLDKTGILKMLTTADILFIPVSPSSYDVNSTVDFIKKVFYIRNEREKIDLPFEYYTIINRVKSGTKAGRELFSMLEANQINLMETTITDYEAYKEHSENFNEIIGPKQKANLEFEKFMLEFLKLVNKFKINEVAKKVLNEN